MCDFFKNLSRFLAHVIYWKFTH